MAITFEFPSKADIPTEVYGNSSGVNPVPFSIKKKYLTIYPIDDWTQFRYPDKCGGRRRGISYIYPKFSEPFYVASFIKDNASICGAEAIFPIEATVDRVNIEGETTYDVELYSDSETVNVSCTFSGKN